MKTTELHIAAESGNVMHVNQCLHQTVDETMIPNELNQLPIYRALILTAEINESLKKNKESVFRTLWHSKPSPEAMILHQDHLGDTVFHLLATLGYHTLLHELLQAHPQGALLANHLMRYPIHLAILNGQLDCVNYLLNIKDVNQLADENKQLPLHYAACYGSREIMQACCEASNDTLLYMTDTDGNTAQDLARIYSNDEAMDILNKYCDTQSEIRSCD